MHHAKWCRLCRFFFFLVLRFAWWCARLEFPLVHVYLKDWNRNCCCCWYLQDVKADIIKLAAAAAEMVGFVGGECDLGKSKGGRRRTHKYIWKMFTQRYMQIQQERGMIRRNTYRKYHMHHNQDYNVKLHSKYVFFYKKILLTMVKIVTFLKATIVNTDMILDEEDKAVAVILWKEILVKDLVLALERTKSGAGLVK